MLADSETSDQLRQQLRRFVVRAFDDDFAEEDWQHTTGGWRVMVFDGTLPVAHVAVVPRVLRIGEHAYRTGYVEGVATVRDRQRSGLGSMVMEAATDLVRSMYELGAPARLLPALRVGAMEGPDVRAGGPGTDPHTRRG